MCLFVNRIAGLFLFLAAITLIIDDTCFCASCILRAYNNEIMFMNNFVTASGVFRFVLSKTELVKELVAKVTDKAEENKGVIMKTVMSILKSKNCDMKVAQKALAQLLK